MEYCFAFLEEEEVLALPEYYWTYAADGSLIVLEKDGETYRDRDGKEYPAMSVKKDHLFEEASTGAYLVPQREKNIDVYAVSWRIPHEAEEVDLAHPSVKYETGNGGHAITVSGYIKNVSKPNDGVNGMRALLIADSDNDANIWQIKADTPKKEDRPNTYKLCYVKKQNGGER